MAAAKTARITTSSRYFVFNCASMAAVLPRFGQWQKRGNV